MIPRFKQFLREALITFGGKANPKYGNVVIVAGGTGSGKDFVIRNLFGIEGKVLDIDAIKSLALKTQATKDSVEKILGKSVTDFNFKNPDDVKDLHNALSISGVISAKDTALKHSILHTDDEILPNLIFNVTLKDFQKFDNVCRECQILGYAKENIHLVWVITDIQVAQKNNKDRQRVVPDDILVATHSGAAMTLQNIVTLSTKIKKYMNGDIWFVFNNKDQHDIQFAKSDKGGSYVNGSNYVKVKSQGSTGVSLPQKVLDRITIYTRTNWNNL